MTPKRTYRLCPDPASRSTEWMQAIGRHKSAAGVNMEVLMMQCNSLLQGSWAKRHQYTFTRLIAVEEIGHPAMQTRYNGYLDILAAELGGSSASPSWQNDNTQLLFHGCAEEVIPLIAKDGFLKSKQKTAAGSWQRFGPGFYFAIQASKSHDYPLGPMRKLPVGSHTRSMLLCKVAKGRVYQTEQNMSDLPGNAPSGYHSVLGIATEKGALKYDELVVYDPASIYPWLKVTYEFEKLSPG